MTNSSKTPEHHSDRKFGYSIERRRSDETTVTLQAAERALDRFWHKVDDLTSSRQVYLPEALIRLLQSNRVVQCNPDLAEPLKRESDSSSRACQTNVALLVSETYYELQYRTEQTIGPSRQQTPKHKLKTRGITILQSDSTVELENLSKLNLQAEQHPKFHVDGRAHGISGNVLPALVHRPTRRGSMGRVPTCHAEHRVCMRKAIWLGMAIYALNSQGSWWHPVPRAASDRENSIPNCAQYGTSIDMGLRLGRGRLLFRECLGIY